MDLYISLYGWQMVVAVLDNRLRTQKFLILRAQVIIVLKPNYNNLPLQINGTHQKSTSTIATAYCDVC
ncbi:MAG: hypothetical protein M3275_01030 [Thermoproteota archaeon]|nr:hypothetical protein [Thermoproteota archaeon]